MEILQVENLNFRYNESSNDALKEISFSVNEGDFVVLCGVSGCGKSTLLRLLKKETVPFGNKKGTVLYRGTRTENLDKRISASEIGFVMQNPEAQIVTDFVWHELAFGLESLGFPTGEIRRRTAEMANYFGIQHWFHKKTHELSGGEKQLLNLASVMAMQPKLILLDEPTAQLDPIAASNFIATLQKINRELGITVLIVEHRLEEVFPIADRVLIMENGELAFDGKPNEVSRFFDGNCCHPMACSLPSAMRIHQLLGYKDNAPITVREGREFLRENFLKTIDSLCIDERTTKNKTVLELKNIFFKYERDGEDVLKDVSLNISEGEHYCILGGNGTGKTTTLKVIAGLLKAYRGKVIVDGKPILSYKDNSLYIKKLAYLPQDPQTVFVEMTVREELFEMCRNLKLSKKNAEEKVDSIAKRLSIERLLDVHPYDLSGGEQQKAALAKVLLAEPRILLLDEPTKAIDAYAKNVLGDIIKELNRAGVAVVTVTHDVEFAASTADRCSLFFDGAIVSVDVPARFFSENSFYTTAANRIARGFYKNAYLCEQVAELCRKNGRKGDLI